MAMPALEADYFASTLTYICEHSDEGAMGLVVNRPSNISLLEVLAQLNLSPRRHWVDTPVVAGGPVSTERGFVLYRGDEIFESSISVCDDVHLSSAMSLLSALAQDDGPEDFLFAFGYAGWQSGQLENEILNNAWLTVEADPQILFATPFEQRLPSAANILGIDLSLVAPQMGYS